MAAKGLSDSVIRATAKAYNEAHGNSYHAAKTVGISRPTFISRVEVGKRKHPELFKDFPVSRGGKHIPPVERTLDQDVELHRARQDAAHSTARLKEALGEIDRLRDKLKDMEWAFKASYEPADWTLPEHKRHKREHQPYLLTSDFQVGEVIRAEETEAGYGYSPEIFQQRYRRLIDTTIYLSFHHGGEGWTYPGIIYARGGDTIDGNLHPEDAGRTVMTNIEAVQLTFEEEAAGILKLAEAFGKVEVKAPGAAGNHDRTSKKPVTKNAVGQSYDTLVNVMLRREFHRDKRVTFQVSESFDVRFPIYDRTVLLTHGDRIGSRGGQGFVGPAATILRGWQKVTMEQASLGHHVDEVHSGHFHYQMCLPFGISNGCMPGYSEFAKSMRMRPSPPMQTLAYYYHQRGIVDYKPIVLA